mmetsp:Transcript_33195/g.87689  ORF Transcript_33195/g.87689 Transcript_33195/m.87689 type:complete len:310 (-) Transcript_33195:470-1399(-)
MPVLSLHEAPAVLWGDGLIRFAHSTYGIVELSKEVKRHGVHDVVHAALAVWRPLFAPAEKVEGALKVLGRPLGYWQNEPYIMPRDYHQIGPSARCPGKRGSVGHAESAQSSREEVEGYSNVVALSDAATCRINCEQAFPPSITAPTFATAAAPAVATTGTTSHAHLNGRGPCIDLEQFVPHRALVIRWTLVFVVDAQTIRHDQLHNGAQRLKWIHHMSHERCRGIKLVLPGDNGIVTCCRSGRDGTCTVDRSAHCRNAARNAAHLALGLQLISATHAPECGDRWHEADSPGFGQSLYACPRMRMTTRPL